MINFKGRIVTFAWNKMLIWKSLSFQGLWRHMGPMLVHLLALLQPLACMMKSLPESKTFSFLPTSLACHLPWWLQRLAPSMCYCLDVVALHHHMPSWLCRVQLGLVSKTICWPGLQSGMCLGWLWHTWEEMKATLPPYCTRYGACQGTAEAKSFLQYHRMSGSCNSPGLLYIAKHCVFWR